MKRPEIKLEEGWSTLLLLLALILTAAITICQADLTEGTHVLPIIGGTAVLIGFLLAKSRFSGRTAHSMALIYGFIIVGYLVGTTLPETMSWHDRIINLGSRQIEWLSKASTGGTSRDGLIFVLQTAAIFWLLGYSAAWYTFRKPRVWRAVLPAGFVLLSVVYYYYGAKPLLYYLAIYVILALLLVARTHLAAQEQIWRKMAVRYERSIYTNFLQTGLVVALLLLSLAYVMPTFAANTQVNDVFSDTRGPWRDFQAAWTRLFAALRAYGITTNDPYQDTMTLGGPRTVSDDLVMDIYVPRQLPNLYWRAITMDTYEDGSWSTKDQDTSLHFPDDGFLPVVSTSSRQVITQTIVNYLPNSSIIYAAPEIVGSSRQMFVDSTMDDAGKQVISAIRSRFVLTLGDDYDVTSRISVADELSLQMASTDYPDWVTDTYLQIPNSLTPETLALAAQLTAGLGNPYDKATAVQNYLRENITYNDQIDSPPADADPIHYTLFESQEAYCTYYASAMAIMLRSQGIPTRIVNGYAQGDFDEETNSYRVRASNAHTWVDVYFPDYGWIQFEPTASIPVVVRQPRLVNELHNSTEDPFLNFDDIEDIRAEDESRFGEEPKATGNTRLPTEAWMDRIFVWQTAVAVIILGIAILLMWVANEFNKQVESDVARSYARLESWAGWLGLKFQTANTPYERANHILAEMPEGSTQVQNLTQQYVLREYSAEHKHDESFSPRDEWRTLRPLFLRKSIQRRLEQWRRKPEI
ncbi:MAG: hypothetical protein CSA11_07185 [Chloroflexi bacterium]|nr:MAG: hypothetical protein CSA11_07185 [Chloroflexota bacterium]